MDKENISAFNDVCAEVFSSLYASFPTPLSLDPSKVAKSSLGSSDSKDAQTAYHTIHWLAQNGFISVQMWTTDGSAHSSILTLSGLQILNQVPDAVSGEKKLGDQIVDATKSGGKGLARKLVDVAIQKGAELAFNAATGGMMSGR